MYNVISYYYITSIITVYVYYYYDGVQETLCLAATDSVRYIESYQSYNYY